MMRIVWVSCIALVLGACGSGTPVPDDEQEAPSCTDGVKNGSESDTDCGGSCSRCADGKRCTGAAECTSGVCTANVCKAPSCTDAVKNGPEMGVDCGGSCPACSQG